MSHPDAVRRFEMDGLVVSVFDTAEALASAAAEAAGAAIRVALVERVSANVMFASGVSQLAFLEALGSMGGLDWSRVTAFHMDEYVGLDAAHPESLQRFMRYRIARRLPLREFHYLNGAASDPQEEADRYASLLRSHPLDLCCLGIGENGHLAFNDPHVADLDDPFDVKVVDLDDASRMQQVGEGRFSTIDEVPPRAITVTIPALMRSRRSIAFAMGLRKARPVRDALRGVVGSACPASALRRHPHAVLYLDADAASLL